ncbi:MAG: hypothetical protein HY966_02060 [Ignavibacteriales bacterium]|nr:hypothetical protein [Ignavibacteriales bacterium]
MRPFRSLATLILFLAASGSVVVCQEKWIEILQLQADSIASDIVGQLGVDEEQTIQLVVRGNQPHVRLVENSLLKSLRLRHRRVRVGKQDDSSETVLEVDVVQQSRTADTSAVSTSDEARKTNTANHESVFLGRYNRDSALESDRGNWLERIVAPLSVIGATAVMIYLFFTVRS